MLIRIEHPHGRPSRAPAIVKHVTRFCRRMRAHCILDVEAPPLIEAEAPSVMVRVGGRVAIIDKDGEVRPSCRQHQVWFTGRTVYDPHALRAHLNRTHAMWLTFAREDRQRGWLNVARGHVNVATKERIYAVHQLA